MDDGSIPDTAPRKSRGLLAFGIAFALGTVAAGIFWRRQVRNLVLRAVPYIRSKGRASHPVLIINRWSGDGKADRYGLVEAATDAGIETIMLERGDDLAELAERAIAEGADAIGMAGGDGSLGIVAGVAAEHEIPFFCVPVGTRNHFALDLGLDRDDPLSALDAIRDGDEILVDYAVAGDRPFLNNISFGLYAQAVHQDGYREKKLATITETLAKNAADVDARESLRFTTPDGRTHDHAFLLIIANNPYVYSGHPDYGRRMRLDAGTLSIDAITEPPSGDTGTTPLRDIHAMQHWEAPSYRIEADGEIRAGLDGEAVGFDSPLEIAIHPRGLRVLVPSGTEPGYVSTGAAAAADLLDLGETIGIGAS
jgi:diacylglycerol kinase family enzyme